MKRNVFIITFIVFILDQVIKFFVEFFLISEYVLLQNFFSLTKVYNTGAAFSIFADAIYFLITINILIFIFLYKYMKYFKINIRNTIAYGLIFGGLLGNLLDRMRIGAVVDYLKFEFGNYIFPIFNFADICLCIGTLLIIIAVFKKEDEVWL